MDTSTPSEVLPFLSLCRVTMKSSYVVQTSAPQGTYLLRGRCAGTEQVLGPGPGKTPSLWSCTCPASSVLFHFTASLIDNVPKYTDKDVNRVQTRFRVAASII